VVQLGTIQGMVKEPKMAKSFSWTLYFKFHNYKLLFSHVYQLHALKYAMKFILELNKSEIVKILHFKIKIAP
jgi:hypothetical protein